MKIILTTSPLEKANQIAELLVKEHLAACVNIVPQITSIYRWEGKINNDSESLLIIKTSNEKAELLKEKILEIHPYDTPEFVVLSPEDVLEKYSAWVLKETS